MPKSVEGWSTRENIQYGDTSSEGPPPLTPGVYAGKIVEAEPKETSKGNPGFKVVFEADKDDRTAGAYRKAYSTMALTQESAWKTSQIANAAGVDAPSDNGFESVSDFCERLVGQPIFARIKTREFDGRKLNDIDRFMNADRAAQEAGGEPVETNVRTMRGRGRAAAAE